MNATETLYKFILDSGGQLEAGTVERWFTMIRQAIISANGSPITPEDAFERLTEGMAGALYRNNGITSPKLLEAIRESLREYMDETEEEEPIATPDFFGSVFPKRSRLPNNEFERQLIGGGIINDGPSDVIFTGKGKPGEVSANITVTRPVTTEGLDIQGNYNTYDAEISRGIDDIFMDTTCDNFFTLPQLYRVITHNKEAKPSDKEKDEMLHSIEAQRVTKGAGNIEKLKEAAAKKGKDVDQLHDNMDRMLLTLTGGYKEINGEEVPYYHIDQRPLPSLFGEMTNHAIEIDANLYYIRKVDSNGKPGEPIANSPDRIAIKGYLLRRIAAMKRDLKFAKDRRRKYEAQRKRNPEKEERALSTFQELKSHTILYSSVFEAAGVAGKTNATLSRHKEYIELCLRYWKSSEYIKGFRERYGTRKDSPDRVEIFLD